MKPDRTKLREFGKLVSAAYPLRNDTPVHFLKLLEKLR